jgi:hypothetical protein
MKMNEEQKNQEVEEKETKEEIIEKADKVEGVKEEAISESVVKSDSDKPVEAKVKRPSFFIQEDDRAKVEVDVMFEKDTGKIVGVTKTGGMDLDLLSISSTSEWFEFTIPSYDNMTTYRQRATRFDRELNRTIVDNMRLRNFLIVYHLKDWSMTDRDGNKIELTHEENDALTNESIDQVYSIFPTLLDVVLTLYERDVLITGA